MLLVRPGDAAERPVRVASLNLCTDELLVALAEPGEIASLSPLARDADLSTVAEAAAALPDNHASAEEILREGVDLVLAETSAANATIQLLRRVGVRVETIETVDRLAGIAPAVERVASWLGRSARGEVLLQRMQARLAAVPRPAGPPPRAIFYESAGWSDGPGTLKDDVMRAAGLVNHAEALGIVGYRPLALERVVADPPDLLITEAYRPGEVSLAERWADHPALRVIPHRVELPTRLLICGTPAIADAVALLAGLGSPMVAAR
jgi:iron complex transport system substrate-binding protein